MEKGNKANATLIPAQWMEQYVLAVSLPPNAHTNNRIQFNSVRRKRVNNEKNRRTNKAHAISNQRVSFSLDSSYLIATARVAFDVWCAVVLLLFLFCCHIHDICDVRPWYTPRICHHFVHVIAVAFYWFDSIPLISCDFRSMSEMTIRIDETHSIRFVRGPHATHTHIDFTTK